MSKRRAVILAVTSELPWPLDTGGHLRSFHLLTGLAKSFDVHVVAGVRRDDEAGLAALRNAGLTVTTVPLQPQGPIGRFADVASAMLRGEPYVLYRRHDRPEMRAALGKVFGRLRPDVLYLDHLDSAVFAKLAPGAVIAADMHNIYSLLAERAGVESGNRPQGLYLRGQARLLRRQEQALARRADMMFAVSPSECEYFRGLGAQNVQLIPNGVDCAAYRHMPVGRIDAEPIVLYLGTMSWVPNAAAARFLADQVLPVVRAAVPRAKLRVVGKNPPDDIRRRHGRNGVEVVGGVPDVKPFLRDAALLAVPLESGGGTRLKILEAFAAGLPVLSTPIGAEGIEAVATRHLEIAPRDEFAARIIQLLTRNDDRGSARLATEARHLAQQLYDWPVIAQAAANAIENISEPLQPRTVAGARCFAPAV